MVHYHHSCVCHFHIFHIFEREVRSSDNLFHHLELVDCVVGWSKCEIENQEGLINLHVQVELIIKKGLHQEELIISPKLLITFHM